MKAMHLINKHPEIGGGEGHGDMLECRRVRRAALNNKVFMTGYKKVAIQTRNGEI
jgi:hypothetical protein